MPPPAEAELAQTAAAELFVDVINAARELSGPTLDAGQPKLNVDKAAGILSTRMAGLRSDPRPGRPLARFF
jgi:hypothetical protein